MASTRHIIITNLENITQYLNFSDIMCLYTAFKLNNIEGLYKKIHITYPMQIEFLHNNYRHFNYLHLMIKTAIIRSHLPLGKNIKSLHIQDSMFYSNPTIMVNDYENLTFIKIHDCDLSKVINLHNMNNLKTLILSKNNIKEIENTKHLRKLQHLDLSFNEISHIKNINNLTNLLKLDLSFNKICKINNLDQLINLTELNLFRNKLKIIENLQNCKKLEFLCLYGNLISDTSISNYLKKIGLPTFPCKYTETIDFTNTQIINLEDYI